MARRKTVKVEINSSEKFIQGKGWSNAFFSEEIMKKPRGWVTEWKRGKNFPSYEEAAKMCEILSVEPEDILVTTEDIALVRSLMDEKKPTVKDDGRISADDVKLLLSKMSETDLWDLFNDVQKEIRGRSSDG